MDKETIEELKAAIKTLTHSTNVQCELMETLSARHSDLISEMKILRNVIEESSSKK
ncbi:hypothetical protein MAA5396_03562 [Marinovum algicola]|uniref:Uncharacterized protein n=1 Tax=Marinovum algicola TaxID=42444 RepID=A0A975WCA1_9RHOB|nr:hypothetical protein [Marinovum algicola]SEJ87788.1 hypothetical protein SAMN04487940_112119 [Marinovum algicola]SLN66718.1 hypothetical protein MAA5396_03562 [Marinovum algicola]